MDGGDELDSLGSEVVGSVVVKFISLFELLFLDKPFTL